MVGISLKDVSVRLPVIQSGRQRSLFAQVAIRASMNRVVIAKNRVVTVHALTDIDLDVEAGSRLAIIGRNGAGKSTLLRVMGGILYPTSGTCEIEGRVATLFDIASCLEAERTGRGNTRFITRLLGLPVAEQDDHIEAVDAFCELGEFFDLPVATYSSGMRLRLAFALNTMIAPDILLIDEVIGVGDAAFIDKAVAHVEALAERTPIIVLSSHSPEILKRFTDKAVHLRDGKIVNAGGTAEVWDEYARTS